MYLFTTICIPILPSAILGEKPGLSIAAIVGIVIGIFIILFIIVDITCYMKNKCGVLMCIKETVGGRSGEDGYSAAKTDDVENL